MFLKFVFRKVLGKSKGSLIKKQMTHFITEEQLVVCDNGSEVPNCKSLKIFF